MSLLSLSRQRGRQRRLHSGRRRLCGIHFGDRLPTSRDAVRRPRARESRCFIGIFERALQRRSVQLVTIVGRARVGKSRMVAELFAYTDATSPEIIRWRQGRCLPYGEGITFWALGEIVKREAAILESDSAEVALQKLDAALLAGRAGATVADPAARAARRRGGGCAGGTAGVVHRLASLPGEPRFWARDGARVRGPALGGRGSARLPRTPRRVGGRRPAPDHLQRAARVVRAPARLGCRSAKRDTPSTSRRCRTTRRPSSFRRSWRRRSQSRD